MTAHNVVPYQQPAAVQQWRGVRPTDMDSAVRMAKAITASGLLPHSYTSAPDPVAACFVALQLGGEVGLAPLASVQNIAVINGRPGLFGPAQLAVVEASGKLAEIEEYLEGEGDQRKAVCVVQRVGRKPRRQEFSVADAKRAGLWDKRGRNGAPGPWQQYPDRMLQARARSFLLRDVFPDILLGLGYSVEELRDNPAEGDGTVTASFEPAVPAPAAEEAPAAPPAPAPAAAKPSAAQLEVLVPGDDPVYFPRTKRGIRECLDWMAAAVNDGGAGIALLNVELLDWMASEKIGLAAEVAALRDAAREALTEGGDPEPDPVDDVGDHEAGLPVDAFGLRRDD